MVMDTIQLLGGYIDEIPYFPILHSIHCFASTASIRSQPGALEFANKHPLASLASNLMIINAGGIMVAASLGKPLIAPFGNVVNTFTAFIFWWLLYFGPGDIAFKLYKFKPLQLLLMFARETRRCKKIMDAINAASAIFSGQWIIIILVGMLGGCSGKFLQTTEESIRKKEIDFSKSEFLQISFVTKASLFISTVFTLVIMNGNFLTGSQALFLCSSALVAINLSMVLLGLPDPFHPIAKVTWKMMSIASQQSEQPGKDEKKKE